jgi:MraZ protein
MFRGSSPTRLDDKGRLKLPADFKHEIDSKYDGQFYITSLDGVVIKLYPLKEWEAIEERAANQPISNRVVQKFLDTTSYYGRPAAMDGQGRLTIAEWLRNKFGLKSEIELLIVGKAKCMEIRFNDEFAKSVEENPLTNEELEQLQQAGI